LSINSEKMREALTMDMLATDLADYLVRKGVRGFHREDDSRLIGP
jgi:argininosuccinate lyase